MIFVVTGCLITLRSRVNMELVESVPLDPVRMLMASSIIPPKAKQNIRPRRHVTQNDRKIERIEEALTNNDLKVRTRPSSKV